MGLLFYYGFFSLKKMETVYRSSQQNLGVKTQNSKKVKPQTLNFTCLKNYWRRKICISVEFIFKPIFQQHQVVFKPIWTTLKSEREWEKISNLKSSQTWTRELTWLRHDEKNIHMARADKTEFSILANFNSLFLI